jgi:hypothetical protein
VTAAFSIKISRTVFKDPSGEITIVESVDATLPFGGFQYSGDASDLLAPLQAPISPGGAVCSLGQVAAIAFSPGATGTASFMPGNLRIEGTQVGTVSGFGDPLAAKSLMLAVLGQNDPSGFTNPPPLRTSVILESDAVWRVGLPATNIPIGTLTTLADLYDQLSAEVGEDASGSRMQVALFRSQSNGDPFQLELGSGITDPDGAPLRVRLSEALQIYNFQSEPLRVELLCTGIPASPWAKSASTGLLLSPGEIRFVFDGPKTTVLKCTFSLLGLVPPLSGAIVDPGDPAGFLSILPVGTAPDPAAVANWVLIGSLQHGDVRLRISGPSFNVLRPEDFLTLKFRFAGMALVGSDVQAPALTMAQPGLQGRLSVTFPPQHLIEHSYYSPDPALSKSNDPSGTETPDSPPIAVRLGEESWLAFVVPPDSEPISLDLQSLLSWSSLVQDIVKPASFLPSEQPPPGEEVVPQQPVSETSLELPYRLTLSPNASAGWSHRHEPVTSGEWTELWHTRLGVRWPIGGTIGEFFVDERDTPVNLALRAVRAIWSPDWPTPAGDPFANPIGPPARGSALTSQDRHDIVANSSDFSQQGFLPQPAFVKRLMLSGLGAWLDVRALWGDNPAKLQEWRHIAAQGRDQYVRVVRRGHLFPFGHRASWVIISERKFFGDLGGDPTFNSAYVIERDFIVVTQPVCRYANLSSSTNKGRDLPFTEIEITTLTTPTLDPPGQHLIVTNADGEPIIFWIYQQGGTPILFHMRGRDQDTSSDPRGRPIDFSAAAIFVDDTATLFDVAAAAEAYNPNPNNLAEAAMGGQKIALARPVISGDTSYEVETFTFKAGSSPVPPSSPADPTSNSFFIYPSVAQATVHLSAVRQLTNPKDSAANQAVTISYYPPYLTDQAGEDFANNGGEIFAQLASPLNIGFGGERANGIASPDMQITGLSRKFGTVAGDFSKLAQAAPEFNPTDFFQGANPTLLGGITLADVIHEVPVPTNVSNAGLQDVADGSVPVLKIDSSAPDKVVAKLSWNPETVPSFSSSGLTITFNVQRLSLTSTVVTPLSPSPEGSEPGDPSLLPPPGSLITSS